MFADLHLHTRFSDGTYSPAELAAQARAHALSTIALTDHDTVEGCALTAAACQKEGLEFIPGSELTAEADGAELHLLAYFIDPTDARLLAEMERFQLARQDRVREMVARLNKLNVPLRVEKVLALANCRSPGRPHVGRALVEAGCCTTIDEAFERFLKKHRPAWVPKFKISAEAAIELIHEAGGVAILAHPGLNRVDDLIPQLIAQGLDGFECYHSRHSGAQAEHYVQMARQHQVLITGGSDCHGYTKGQPLIGTVRLPYEHVLQLKARVAELRVQRSGPTLFRAA